MQQCITCFLQNIWAPTVPRAPLITGGPFNSNILCFAFTLQLGSPELVNPQCSERGEHPLAFLCGVPFCTYHCKGNGSLTHPVCLAQGSQGNMNVDSRKKWLSGRRHTQVSATPFFSSFTPKNRPAPPLFILLFHFWPLFFLFFSHGQAHMTAAIYLSSYL